MQNAIEFHKNGQLSAAKNLYLKLLSSDKNNVDVNNNLSMLYLHLNEVASALNHIKKAVDVTNPNVTHWNSYARILARLNNPIESERALLKIFNSNFTPSSISELKKLQHIHLGVPLPVSIEKLLLQKLSENDYVFVINKALILKLLLNQNYLINKILGVTYSRLNKIGEAIKYYKILLEHKSVIAEDYNNVANCYLKLGKVSEAREYSNIALSKSPDLLPALITYAIILREMKEISLSKAVLKKAINKDPSAKESKLQLAKTEIELGNLTEAQTLINELLLAFPNDQSVLIEGAYILQNAQEEEQAEEIYSNVLKLDDQNWLAKNNLAIIYKNQGKIQASKKLLKEILLKDANNVSALNNLGLIELEKGPNNLASFYFEKIIDTQPSFVSAYWNLQGTVRNYESALKLMKEAMTFQGCDEKFKYMRAIYEYLLGNRDKAGILTLDPKENNFYKSSFEWFVGYAGNSKVFFDRWSFFDHILDLCDPQRPFYEFGVWMGVSFRYLKSRITAGYGFDTFEGLPEDWGAEKKGSYSSRGEIPILENSIFVKGKFKDTLPKFFSEKREIACLINFDADLYTSTKCALENCISVIDAETILIFDEFFMHETWKSDEALALQEFCQQHAYVYEVIAVSFFTKQVAVRLVSK